MTLRKQRIGAAVVSDEILKGEREINATVAALYGDARLTEIVDQEGDIDIEDLIPEETVVVTRTHTGYVKRASLSEYRSQRRGGKGRRGMTTKDEDFVTHMHVKLHRRLLSKVAEYDDVEVQPVDE